MELTGRLHLAALLQWATDNLAADPNRPGTAREALIAEAIGDLARLLDRAEALQPAMLESSRALIEARAQLADSWPPSKRTWPASRRKPRFRR